MGNKLIIAILILTAVGCGLLLAIAQMPMVANAVGTAHASVAYMRAGGDGAARLEQIEPYAVAFQIVVLISFALFFVLGISPKRRSKAFLLLTAGYRGLTRLVWFKIVFDYQHFLTTGQTPYFLGFPVSTAWVLYGVWFCGILLIAFYCLGFSSFIYTKEDEREFNALVESVRANNN